jgi:hypothetical protein
MGAALNSVFGGGGLGAIMNIASAMFPPLGIATSVANMITQGVGQAVNGAAQQLCQTAGMPKFLADMIGGAVKDVIGKLTQPSQQGCDQAAQGQFGNDIKQLIDDLTKSLFDGAKKCMEEGKDDKKCNGGGGKGGKQSAGSWLEAIARSMGEAQGNKAAKLVELSNKLKDISSRDHGDLKGDDLTKAQQQDAKDMNVANAEFQGASQEYQLLTTAFSTAIKAIGESVKAMASKQ